MSWLISLERSVEIRRIRRTLALGRVMRDPMHSDQLLLDLRMPWDGQSPRYLTKGHKFVSFASSGMSRVEVGAQVEQLELFPEGTHYGT